VHSDINVLPNATAGTYTRASGSGCRCLWHFVRHRDSNSCGSHRYISALPRRSRLDNQQRSRGVLPIRQRVPFERLSGHNRQWYRIRKPGSRHRTYTISCTGLRKRECSAAVTVAIFLPAASRDVGEHEVPLIACRRRGPYGKCFWRHRLLRFRQRSVQGIHARELSGRTPGFREQ